MDKVDSMGEANGWTALVERTPGQPFDPDCKLETLTYICKAKTRERNIQRAKTKRKNLARLAELQAKAEADKKQTTNSN